MLGYQVGIEIHLVDHVSMAMAKVNQAMMLAHGHTVKFQQQMAKLQNTMMKFQAMSVAGNAMFSTAASDLNAMIDPAKEYAHQLNLMNMAGMEHVEIQKNIQAAWETSRNIPTTNPASNMAALGDMRIVFGDDPKHLAEARSLLPDFAKIQTIMSAATHDQAAGHQQTDQIFAAVKGIEMLGKIRTEEQFRHYAEQMTRVMVATQGRVLPSDYSGMIKYARQMKLTMSEDMLFKVAPELIMEMKSQGGGAGSGGGPGAMIAALGRLGVQGIMNKATFKNLQDIGMIQDGYVGNDMGAAQNALVGKELLARNSAEWVNTVLIPHITAAFPELADFEGDPQKEFAVQMKVLDVFRGNQNAVALIMEEFNKRNQFVKFGAMFDKTGGIEKMYQASLNDPAVAETALTESWKTVMMSLGKVLIPFIPYINQFAAALQLVAKFFVDNPIIAKFVVMGLVATTIVGAILALVGAIGLLALPAIVMGATLGELAVVAGWVIIAIGIVTNVLVYASSALNLFGKILKIFPGMLSSIGFQMMGTAITNFWQKFIAPIFIGLLNFVKPILRIFDPKAFAIADALTAGVESAQPAIGVPSKKPSASTVNQNNPSVNIAEGAIKIVTSGGNPADIAKSVIEELSRQMQRNILTNTTGGGLWNAPSLSGSGG